MQKGTYRKTAAARAHFSTARAPARHAPQARQSGGLYEHLEVLHHLLLSAEVAEAQRSQGVLKLLLGRRQRLFSYIEIIVHYSFIFQSNAKLSILFVIITQNHKNISTAADGGVTVSGRPPCRRSVSTAAPARSLAFELFIDKQRLSYYNYNTNKYFGR